MVSNNGGPIEAISTLETVPCYTGNRRKAGKCLISECHISSIPTVLLTFPVVSLLAAVCSSLCL